MEENFIKSSITNQVTNKWDYYVFVFALIDTLFLPYFWLVTVPLSLPVVIYWAIKRIKILNYNVEFKMFRVMVLLMIFSTVLGSVIAPSHSYDNIIFLIKYLYVFILYFNFSFVIKNNNIKIKKYLLAFVFFVLVFAILYYLDKSLYQSLKNIWNYRANIFVVENYRNLIGYRYSFIWMDPNNIGYMIVAICLFLFSNEYTSFSEKVLILGSSIIIIIATMSNGAFLSLGIGISAYLITIITRIFKIRTKIKIKIRLLNYLLFIALIIVGIYLIPKVPDFLNSTIAIESFERISENSGDSRFRIWTRVLQNIKWYEYILYIFIGTGGVTLQGGQSISPHNGHLYWIMGYGLISYYIFMYIIFRKRKFTPISKYVWIIPVFIGFTINIMIGEMKLTAILMLLVACSSNYSYSKKYKE